MMPRTLTIELDDDIAARAEDAGLLSNHEIEELLLREMRCRAGRELMAMTQPIRDANYPEIPIEQLAAEIRAGRRLKRTMELAHAANGASMSEEDIQQIVDEVRTERRAERSNTH